eukprot:Protomagalhaensia_sp_Gyna_25__5621@NODE_781_length_2628_cov_94_008884_g599_i1_p2_GENE_NODE_781_length_2628_cov_94_008884_g599_i1NODE_781_length_2628_cov_94_008884_g599_i1_p2_ORF_typecomplete_len336_score44_94PseudoU_synth_1/PF01416_20/0_014PseudoU_synth_1/PF01416_20/5_7e24DUF2344/PF10105_9/0_12_NODE_781_length_2628_cov_94_008884_g599_i1741081
MPEKTKGFDWTQAQVSQFLLRISYLGTNFFGLAWQTPNSCSGLFEESHKKKRRRIQSPDWLPSNPSEPLSGSNHEQTVPTVEGALIEALQKARLIRDRDSCNFSRCGRTDKGVHARANYISLKLRLKPKRKNDHDHYDYCGILNAILPRTIRVLEVQPVPLWFDARFHCLYRAYKYFFATGGLNLPLLKAASTQFLGEHDFRNFCKVDPSTQKTHTRRVLKFEIEVINETVAVATVLGPAFLWHQVRCMMGVLLAIGKEQLDPRMIMRWLDPIETPVKPSYVMAPPEGLVLWDCAFEGMSFDSEIQKSRNANFEVILTELAVHQQVVECLNSTVR